MRKPKARSYNQLNRVFKDVHGDHNYCTRLAFSVITGKSAGKAIAIAKRYVDGFELGKGLHMSQIRDYFEAEFGDFPQEFYVALQQRAVLDERAARLKHVKKHGILMRRGRFLVSFS